MLLKTNNDMNTAVSFEHPAFMAYVYVFHLSKKSKIDYVDIDKTAAILEKPTFKGGTQKGGGKKKLS